MLASPGSVKCRCSLRLPVTITTFFLVRPQVRNCLETKEGYSDACSNNEGRKARSYLYSTEQKTRSITMGLKPETKQQQQKKDA